MAACAILVAVLIASPPPPEEHARALCLSGDHERALGILDALLDGPAGKAPEPARRLELEILRARCLFELGDYPACEARLKALLAGPAGPESPGRAECLARLAETLSLRGHHDEAIAALGDALRLGDAPALRRQTITVLLRACRAEAVLPHADALLAADPAEPFAHFARGLALAGGDRLQEAIEELAWGLALPGAARDARMALAQTLGKLDRPAQALAHLAEILAENPFDQEACYAAAQQLRRLKSPGTAEAAAGMQRYFLSLQEAFGETSRDPAFEAVGRAAQAALMRAGEWKRISAFDRALPEIRRAQAVARGDPEPWLYEADFWAAAGLLAEADLALARLDARAGGAAGDAAGQARKLRAALAAAMEKLRAQAGTPLGDARIAVARTAWQDSRPCLEALLGAAFAAGELELADRAARLLLARDPDSVRALAFLARRAATGALLPPRLHYLARLARLLPEDAGVAARLRDARARLRGEEPSAAGSPPPAR
ncbi:MAG TPA: hypothetical protein DCM87_19575 [Planctomycetes bacterium]|nr:hypothetical protein [Planctomycetota bacterium]